MVYYCFTHITKSYKIIQDLCYLYLFGRLNFQVSKDALCIDEHGW